MTRPVFIGDELSVTFDQLDQGDVATLGGAEGHHAAAVKRIQPGEYLDVVNGCGVRLLCDVVGVSKNTVTVRVQERRVEEAPAQRLILVQALAKGGRDEQAIAQATEIGVDQVIPWMASRCEVHWRGPKVERGASKWQASVQNAAKQARRAFIPTVGEPRDSTRLTEWITEFVASGGSCLLCHEEAVHPLSTFLRDHLPTGDIAVVVGPEGGVSPEEVDSFQGAGATTVLLGPHVLRSASAGPAALTLVSAAVGRW